MGLYEDIADSHCYGSYADENAANFGATRIMGTEWIPKTRSGDTP
jgi:hypothetical protein